MKKLLLAFVGLAIGQSVFAIPFNQKNLHVSVVSYPAGAGIVYADVKPADKNYVKEQSGWGETSTFKATLQQNGSDCYEQGMYEAVVSAKANDGYEFVCYSYEYYPGSKSIYLKPDLYLEASNFDENTRTYTEATNALGVNGTGAILNVYTGGREDPNDQTITRDNLFASDNWSAEPDIVVNAIFRKIGDKYPIIDYELGIEDIEFDHQAREEFDNRLYNLQGMIVDENYKGIVIRNGKKYLNK